MHSETGRPATYDAEVLEDMAEVVRKRKSEQDGPDEAKMMQLLFEQAHATGDRQGRIVDDPCYNTMSKAK